MSMTTTGVCLAIAGGLVMTGCIDRNATRRAVTGRVTSCWDQRMLIDVETADGQLIHLDVLSGMPMCGNFKSGGLWQINYRQDTSSQFVAIDSVKRVAR